VGDFWAFKNCSAMEKRPGQIFISFANEAEPLALTIKDALKKKGFKPWIYPDKMQLGQDWEKVQQVEMERSEWLICLISKSVINDRERERVVWKELNYAIKRTEENGAYNSYLIPVLVNVSEIPGEIKQLHAIDYDREGIEGILKALPKQKSDRIWIQLFRLFLLLLILIAILITALYFNYANKKTTDKPASQTARFQTQIIDKYTRQPVKDVIAFVINKAKKDTIAISDLSGSDGRVYFELDTSQRITVSVNFSHKNYEDDRLLFELPSSLVQPQFILTPKIKPDTTKKKVFNPGQSNTEKYYWTEGIELTIEQRKKITQSCGFEYQQGRGLKFTYDYDHTKYICLNTGCRFLGSPVKLSGNGFNEQVGDPLKESPGIALSKEEWENSISDTLEEHAKKNQEQVFNLLKTWLCAS
jgi:uncharacterized protein (UPF0333 family)